MSMANLGAQPKSREELIAILERFANAYGLYIDDRYLDDGTETFLEWLPHSLFRNDIEEMFDDAWEAVYAEGKITPATPEEVSFEEAEFQEHRFDDDANL